MSSPVHDSALAARIRRSIRERLPLGTALKGPIARELGLSPRSIDRELARRGTSFREILDDLRRELAERHLSATSPSLAEVARRLGYANAANFTRAFRRWNGESPRSFRQRAGAK